jgi:hypothetical protein
MARTEVGAQKPGFLAAVTPTEFSMLAVDGIKFVNNGTEWLLLDNGTAGSVNITVKVPPSRTIYGSTIPDKVYAIPATSKRLVGPFPVDVYRRSENEAGGDPFYTYVDTATNAVKVTVISGL